MVHDTILAVVCFIAHKILEDHIPCKRSRSGSFQGHLNVMIMGVSSLIFILDPSEIIGGNIIRKILSPRTHGASPETPPHRLFESIVIDQFYFLSCEYEQFHV